MCGSDMKEGAKFSGLPERVLQIGEGNFLRAFADYIIEMANRAGVYSSSVVIAQAIPHGSCEKINAANGEYTVLMRGIEKGEVVQKAERITSVSRCVSIYNDYEAFLACAENHELEIVISNTTEAGITFFGGDKFTDTPPSTFPAKMTVFLHKRYKFFGGDRSKGLFFLPVELIEDNGTRLKEAIVEYARLWGLEDDFILWLSDACCFANTLVDRIVTGFPYDESREIFANLGYEDELLVTCEPFLFWAIECPAKWAVRFPIDRLGLNIVYSENIQAYRVRKVRILNGAHTLSVLAAYMAGHDIVLDMMNDPKFNSHIRNAMFKEIIPTINLPENELSGYAESVLERFSNPFIKHRLLDISLNSVSKYKARCLYTLIDYKEKFGKIPAAIAYAFAALIVFYRGEWLDGKYYGTRDAERYEIRDDELNLKDMHKAWQGENTVYDILSNERMWGSDLNKIEGLTEIIESYIDKGSLKEYYECVF